MYVNHFLCFTNSWRSLWLYIIIAIRNLVNFRHLERKTKAAAAIYFLDGKRLYLLYKKILLQFLTVLFELAFIACIFIALFTPDSTIFQIFSENLMLKGTIDIEWTLLTIAILSAFDCTMAGFSGWTMFVHYCYIQGCHKMAKNELKTSCNSNLDLHFREVS